MSASLNGIRTASVTDITNVNFGNVQLGSISGLKYNDLNGNGLRDPNEPTLSNWQIYLDLNTNSQLDANEPATFTDGAGNYFFANLPPGTYRVREVLQPNWKRTTPNPEPITLNSGTNIGGVNFGNLFFAGNISGTKFNDANGNGLIEPGEPPLAGWQIYLDLNTNDRIDDGEPFTFTNAEGNYAFVNIPPATYSVREVLQPNWRQTVPNPGPIPINPGSNIANVNFGNNFLIGSISGIKYNDLNANGLRDATDPPLANWQIYIDSNGNNQFDAGESTTLTNAEGSYTFGNVPSGTYTVREVLQPGWVQITPNPGPITIDGGTVVTGINFGNNLPTGSISGFKYNDLNADGVSQPTEPRIANWPIYLDLNENNQYDSTEPLALTNLEGNFSFINLPPGSYRVREIQQPGFRRTTPNPTPITIGNGTNATNISFGNVFQVGSISGVKFNDFNANGLLDAGEPPIANAQIYIDLNNSGLPDANEPTAFTDIQGNYSFRNVPVGTYVLREVVPPGFLPTTPAVTVTVVPGRDADRLDPLTGETEREGVDKQFQDDPLTLNRKGSEPFLKGAGEQLFSMAGVEEVSTLFQEITDSLGARNTLANSDLLKGEWGQEFRSGLSFNTDEGLTVASGELGSRSLIGNLNRV